MIFVFVGPSWRSQRAWFLPLLRVEHSSTLAADRLLSSGKGCAAGAPAAGGRNDKEMKTKWAAFTELTVNLYYKLQRLPKGMLAAAVTNMPLGFYEHPCYTNPATVKAYNLHSNKY